MTFINEYISREDFAKFRLPEYDDAFGMGAVFSDNWTIDRERDMILRLVGRGREERAGRSEYAFYWRNRWNIVGVSVADCGGTRNGPQWVRYRLAIPHQVPPSVPELRELFLRDLKEALIAYRDCGVRSNATEFSVFFDE
jgi:hypothetical protein